MDSLFRSRARFVGATLLGFLMSATATSAGAQTRGSIRALRDTVIIGVADTAAHLYRSAEGKARDQTARRVIRDQLSLDEVWRTLDDLLPVPRIDFGRSDVLVAAMGAWGYLGPMINIDTILTRGAERIAIVRVTDVGEDCLPASEMTYPIDIVVVPRDSTRTTRFVERKTRLHGCRPSPSPILRWNTPGVAPGATATGYDFDSPSSGSRVSAIPPDGVESSLYAPENLTEDYRYAGWLMRDIVLVRFDLASSQAQRQAAVDLVEGTQVGGRIFGENGDGLYLIRLPKDTTNNRLFAAVAKLEGTAGVRWAMPDVVFFGGEFRDPAIRDSVIIGVADTAAHLYRDAEGNGPRKPARRVIREQRDLDEVWSTLDHPLAAPRIDFSQSDVLVAAFGAHGSVGPTINIDTVLIRDAKRTVVVRVTDLPEQCLVHSALTHPIDIVVVPHDSTRTTQFVERRARFPGCLPRSAAIRRYRRP